MDRMTQPTGITRPNDSDAAPPHDLTGQILDDFRILRKLGQGGMGQVYLAEQISLKRKVAFKILRAELAADSVSLQRFKAEAENVARATHANIVQVYAIGECKGLNYMALEYVEGRNLREFLEKKGPPEVLLALSIMRQVASALQRATELGIIHRDIKPENILLTRKGEVKVTDFGLSRCFAENVQPLHLTQSGVSMGTPLYMSPEQVEGKPVDHRTDIYSFGVTSYHLLAGQPPFRGQNPFEIAVQHVQKEPEPLAQIRPDLPEELCTLVGRMMAKKADDRIQTGREIVKELGRLRDAVVGIAGKVSNPVVSTGPVEPQAGDSVTTQAVPFLRRRLLPWLVAASLGLALVGGWWLGRKRPQPPSPPEPISEPFSVEIAQKEREQELIKLVKEYTSAENRLDIMTGLKHSIDLGFLYLKSWRLEEAEKFFQNLDLPEQKIFQYRTLGKLGQAMVLAFQNRPAESNKLFFLVLRPDKEEKSEKWVGKLNRFWIHGSPAVREMIAEALNHNYRNAPETFPKMLEPFRNPPQPRTKNNS